MILVIFTGSRILYQEDCLARDGILKPPEPLVIHALPNTNAEAGLLNEYRINISRVILTRTRPAAYKGVSITV